MDEDKLARLKEKGIEPSTVEEIFGLSPGEAALIDLKLYFAKYIREIRKENRITQKTLATLMGSSQPRVATIERGVPPVSLDLIFKALLALEVPLTRIAQILDSFEPPDYKGPKTVDPVNNEPRNRLRAIRAYENQIRTALQVEEEVDIYLDA